MSTLSKEDYLKRYLNPVESGDYKKRKKKRGDKVKKVRGMKIVDDDVSWSKIGPKDDDDLPEDLLTQEEKPQIEVIDNRTEEEKALDAYRKSDKWKTLKNNQQEQEKDSDGDFDHIPRRKPPRHDSDSDIDIPRRPKKRHDSGSESDGPRRKSGSSKSKRYDSNSDVEVPRRKSGKVQNKQRHDSGSSDSDLEVPREKHKLKDRRPLKDSDSDIRTSKRKSPERKKLQHNKRHDSESDLDLPRSKVSTKSNNIHKKVKRKSSSDSDIEVPRSRKQRHDSSSDSESTNRRTKGLVRKSGEDKYAISKVCRSRHDSDSDLELPRQTTKSDASKEMKKKKAQMSGGGAGGLTSRQELKKELLERKKMESDIDRLAKESSKSATVFREKGGKKRDLEKERLEQEAENREKQKKIDKYDKWGKGVTQGNMKDYALEDLIHESNKPLARYRDDADLDAFQRSQMRDGDPMAEYLAKKRNKEAGNMPSMPKYRGPAPPPNRYGIQPGYRWDGVDRSNGFEKKFFMKQSEGTAQRQEAYKWSVEDM